MAGLQVFSGDLRLKKVGTFPCRPFPVFVQFLWDPDLGVLTASHPASVLPDKPAVRCHAVREHDSLCSIGNLIERTRRRRTSGGRSPTTTAAERRYSNRSSPAGLEHKKSHPSDDSFSISLRERDGIRTLPMSGKLIKSRRNAHCLKCVYRLSTTCKSEWKAVKGSAEQIHFTPLLLVVAVEITHY